MYLVNTFFTALAFISWVADTGPHDARAMVIAGDIYALVSWNVTFCPFPATVAQAPPLHVLSIPTAQDWTRCYKWTETTLEHKRTPFVHHTRDSSRLLCLRDLPHFPYILFHYKFLSKSSILIWLTPTVTGFGSLSDYV